MTTTAITDPWIERQIQAGNLAPGARGLSRDEAAAQYNAANALDSTDPDFIYTPGQAQAVARDALATIDIEVPAATRVLLTDAHVGLRCTNYLLNPGQIEFAIDQHRLISGEDLSADALIAALPWE
ncbi:hypothetical protein O4157_14930 [Gordonia amicalis]|uniref:hypothetical protein n=1 Tax=Gordonia amicalis TaxID=89053 RepID=UPI0022B462BA|nr:hypothetical protein [Gordonia amicalis]MCZ4652719.1 hypothetical protein [Gordonia amicalis]